MGADFKNQCHSVASNMNCLWNLNHIVGSHQIVWTSLLFPTIYEMNNRGKMYWEINYACYLQAAPSFPSTFPHIFSGRYSNLRCFIPCAIDQVLLLFVLSIALYLCLCTILGFGALCYLAITQGHP
jgi:hypothetical protein